MNHHTPETLENILLVTRHQESILNAYYTDNDGEIVTMTLYDISETDFMGDDDASLRYKWDCVIFYLMLILCFPPI